MFKLIRAVSLNCFISALFLQHENYILLFPWKWKCLSLSLIWLFATPWTVAHQAPLSMEFSRQDYWIGLPFPSPGDLPDSGIIPGSPALQADSLLTELQGKLLSQNRHIKNIYLGNLFVFTFRRLQFCKKKNKILIIKWKDISICAFPSPYFSIHCSACSVSSWKSIPSNRGSKYMGLHNGLALINSINH